MPLSQGPRKDGICYATQNRQDAVKALAEQCDLVIVVGSPNSSNLRRLREVAVARGIDGYLVDGPQQIDPAWLAGKRKIGASAPEILVRRVVDRNGALYRGAYRGRSRALGWGPRGRVVPAAEEAGVVRSRSRPAVRSAELRRGS